MPIRNPSGHTLIATPWPWLLAAAVTGALVLGCGEDSAAAPAPATKRQGPPAQLALLVGINDYAPSGHDHDFGPLAGAENDVERASALLQERFGFAAGDIVVLKGEHATHEGIVREFHRHLIQQAAASTRVVFWFSGHGSRVPDESAQDGAPRATGESPFDDTLVAYDSRATAPDGGFDLTDDELHSLLAALPAKDVLVVTDCCHSGGVLRGGARGPGVREARAGTVPLRRALVQPFWPATVPLRDDPEHEDLPAVVQLAACGAQEEAGEFATPHGTFGTLTWFLTQVLAEGKPEQSWGEVAAIVRARVTGLGTRPGQRVQLVGNGERAVFGGKGRPVPDGFQVDRDGASTLCVGAGSLHGIAEGADLQLLGLGGKAIGSARVYKVRTTTCTADWTGPGLVPDVAMRAVPMTLGQGQPRLRVAIEDLDGELLDGSAVALATVPAEAEYVLRPVGDRLGLFDRQGRCVRSMDHSAGAVHEQLVREQRFRTLWEGVAAPGRYQLELKIEPASAAKVAAKDVPAALLQPTIGRGPGGVVAVVGADVIGKEDGGALMSLTVTNDNDEDLFIAVVSATETREVNVLIGASEDNLVRAHDSVSKRVWLGPTEGWPKDQPMIDRYIVIATPRYADFKPFASRATMELTRGGGSPELPPFLRAVLGAGRTRGDMDKPAWGIASCDLQLVTPDVFTKTQAK